jgi:predicted enzyme related to lactoylglutathione lyase
MTGPDTASGVDGLADDLRVTHSEGIRSAADRERATAHPGTPRGISRSADDAGPLHPEGLPSAVERPAVRTGPSSSTARATHPLSVSAIVIGSDAPLALAAFWSEVLGVPVAPGSTGTSASLMTSPRVPRLAFERTDEPVRRGAMSIRVWTDELDEQVARLTALGAPVSRPRSRFVDLDVVEAVDPEGNRLVLVRE